MKSFLRLGHIVWIIIRLRPTKKRSPGKSLRLILEKLGPVFIKFGQALSTRQDILDPDIANELIKLQDQVPPFSGHTAQRQCEDIVAEFDTTALASGSIAQVHAAVLKNGEVVAIKLLRPRIEKKIKRDIAVLYRLATFSQLFKKLKRFKPLEIVREFEESILGELDLQREAANSSQLRRHFLNSSLLYVPKINWEYTRKNILVMERIHGIPIRNKEELINCNINLKKLAERLIELFFTQVFQNNFFHADMHPGNLFVSPDNPLNPKIIAVDFGIMGSLSERDQRYIAENFLAFFKRDYRRVAILHIQSGWAPAHTRVDQLETAIRTVAEPLLERPLGDISFGQLLLGLFQMAAQFEINIQPQLILLQKTLVSVEGLARQIYPELDIWSTARPHLERWIKAQNSPKVFLKLIYDIIQQWKREEYDKRNGEYHERNTRGR